MSIQIYVNVTGYDAVEVSMSNRNAGIVLRSMGINLFPDCAGTMDASEFLGRAAAALADDRRSDAAVEDVAVTANFYECGIPAGYVSERLVQLITVAGTALGAGAQVAWS